MGPYMSGFLLTWFTSSNRRSGTWHQDSHHLGRDVVVLLGLTPWSDDCLIR